MLRACPKARMSSWARRTPTRLTRKQPVSERGRARQNAGLSCFWPLEVRSSHAGASRAAPRADDVSISLTPQLWRPFRMEKPQACPERSERDLKSESCATRSLGREHRAISHFALPDEAPCPLRERGSRGCGRCDQGLRTALAHERASKR